MLRPRCWLLCSRLSLCIRGLAVVAMGMLCLSAVGCGGSDTGGRLAVSGEVQLGGQPLDRGAIQFEPLDKSSKLDAGAVITNGKFHIPAEKGLPPGKYRVSITSSDQPPETRSGNDIMANPGPPPKERIAAKYNTESKEEAEVKAGSPNKFTFKVEAAGS